MPFIYPLTEFRDFQEVSALEHSAKSANVWLRVAGIKNTELGALHGYVQEPIAVLPIPGHLALQAYNARWSNPSTIRAQNLFSFAVLMKRGRAFRRTWSYERAFSFVSLYVAHLYKRCGNVATEGTKTC